MHVLDLNRAASRLDQWEKSGMLRLGTPRSFSRGDVILAQGPGAASAALITRGLAKVVADDVSLALLGDGDLIGEEAAILPGLIRTENRVTVTIAVTPVTARMFPAAELRRFLAANPLALQTAAQGVCTRMLTAENRIARTANNNAVHLLARVLCNLASYGTVKGKPGNSVTVIPFGFTQSELAGWIGYCTETVGRALRDWKSRGIAFVSPASIRIHDRDTLARIAGIRKNSPAQAQPGWGRMADRQVTIDALRSGPRARRPVPAPAAARRPAPC